MRRTILAASILACAAGALAQTPQAPRMPATPAAGAPGTATPQPYGQPQSAPIQRQGPGTAPLLPPPQGQSLPRLAPQAPKDQAIPLLEQQLQRNRQPVEPGQKRD
ncbi:hypothetical protein ACIGKL_22000 [Pseudomonas sp. NPDC077186]|uniref:hypothetical protein n=1 Tax=Pseudomonas sp. NPDC077186 TaxID=3364421 RepID=UPI0037CA4BD5